MEPLQILTDEHELIRSYLNDTSVALYQMSNNKWPEKEFFEMGVEFTKSFSDKFHHYKEEYIMFLKLAQKKKGSIDSEIMLLRDQHESARNFTIGISRSLDKYTQKDSVHAAAIAENLGYYNLLLRQHIHREDHIFYPMARELFTESEQNDMLEDFKKAEEKFQPDFVGISKAKVEKMSALLKEQFGDEYESRLEFITKIHK